MNWKHAQRHAGKPEGQPRAVYNIQMQWMQARHAGVVNAT
jgi:hypothetical protein